MAVENPGDSKREVFTQTVAIGWFAIISVAGAAAGLMSVVALENLGIIQPVKNPRDGRFISLALKTTGTNQSTSAS